jgi:5'-3' exonuclease|tara:strand:- start:1723 stop:2484 length:762 start_codon:yes stop_codon:yes gene_type:complete
MLKKETIGMKPTNKIIGIVDGDVLIYRACNKAIKEELDVRKTFDKIYDEVKMNTACDKYSLHISGGGNFRKEIKQDFLKYKGKRREKPENYLECRDYVTKNHNPIMVPNYEADDTASVEAYKYIKENQLYMLITLDKDWKTIGGLFYNLLYNNLFAVSTVEGIEFFHQQLLTGDAVDNIPGIEGVGPVKANRILKDKNLKDQFKAIIKAYKTHYPKDFKARLNVMGTMLYLIKDFKDHSKWSIDYWKGYINGI